MISTKNIVEENINSIRRNKYVFKNIFIFKTAPLFSKTNEYIHCFMIAFLKMLNSDVSKKAMIQDRISIKEHTVLHKKSSVPLRKPQTEINRMYNHV